MTTNSIRRSDPFADPNGFANDERNLVAESTLNVGRNASLTLGTDALIVPWYRPIVLKNKAGAYHVSEQMKGFEKESTSTRSVPYFNILWATCDKLDLTIHYARPTSKSSSSHAVRVTYINYELDVSTTSAYTSAKSWTARLLDRAYGSSQRSKRIKILINPYGGAGKAGKIYTSQVEPILAAARCEVDAERTAYSGHATEIAKKLDIGVYDVLATCSGDGLVYECFNGLAKKPNAAEALHKVALAQFPCGTGNAMSWNLNGTGDCSMAALCVVKGLRTPFDLSSVTQGERRTISFLSQSIGIVAESDLGTDNIRWMGDARFTYGFLIRLLGKTVYPCDIAVKTEIDNKSDIKKHYAAQRAKKDSQDFGDQSSTSSNFLALNSVEGLPVLKYGTVNSSLPSPGSVSGWTPLTAYPNLGNLYAGNMCIMAEDAPFFTSSLPSDGMMDLVTIDGDIGRMKALNLMMAIPKGTFFDTECVRFRKVVAYRVVPRFGKWANVEIDSQGQKVSTVGRVLKVVGLSGGKAGMDGGYISIDGEKYPFEPFQVEVHKALGTVLSRSGRIYESPGPTGWEDFAEGQDEGDTVQS